MNRGVIYFNIGSSHLVRLLISLKSLRDHYAGPVAILSEGGDTGEICSLIGKALMAEMIEWNCGVPEGKNRRYLAKTRYHLGSPYDTTIALDADTLVVGEIDELFQEAEQAEFCVAQFANWKSRHGIIQKRLRMWEAIRSFDINPAVNFGPAINCGVVAFRKGASFYCDWFKMAMQGRDLFIPDEVCCQLTLYRYPHRILDRKWNCSCKYDDPSIPDTRIIHYHGGKHCCPGLPFQGKRWFNEFKAVIDCDLASITKWMPAGDVTLRRFLESTIPCNAKTV
jgi:hypothetical protein